MENADSDPMVMSTLETLDMTVMDGYDRDEMEYLEELENEGAFQHSVPEPEHVWDIPAFSDVSAWDANEPDDEFLGRNFGQFGSIGIGSTFSLKADAIYAVQKYSLLHRVEYHTKESDTRILVLHCREGEDRCPWRIRIIKKNNASYWEVRKWKGDHTCNSDFIAKENVHLTRHFIAMDIGDVISERSRLSPSEIRARIFKDYGYEIRYLKAWQAKRQALITIFGDWDDSFAKLPRYMQALEESNPGTFIRWNCIWDEENMCMVINRVFWSFGPCIDAFRHCWPVMSIDGTHLYGKYNGTLLVAVALDANNHVLPIAFALVERENNSSWSWFMQCIREGVTDRIGLCIISDRHKGILRAMQEPGWAEPRAYHRVCIRHLQSNFNVKVKNTNLKKRMGHVAHHRQCVKFEREYKELIDLLHERPTVVNWLQGMQWSKWTMSYDEGGRRWGSMTTNVVECFNNILKGSRDLPICALVQFTFQQCNTYFCKRRDMFLTSASPFPPKVELRLRELRERAECHRVTVFDPTEGVYQVRTVRKHVIHAVHLEDRTCTCGKWTIFHYPCSHVLAVCKSEGIPYMQFVDHHYTLEAYYATWAFTFNVIPAESRWSPYHGLPHFPNPCFRRSKVGRTPSRRRHNEMDKGESSSQGHARVRKCGLCHGTRHNRRGCPNRQPG